MSVRELASVGTDVVNLQYTRAELLDLPWASFPSRMDLVEARMRLCFDPLCCSSGMALSGGKPRKHH